MNIQHRFPKIPVTAKQTNGKKPRAQGCCRFVLTAWLGLLLWGGPGAASADTVFNALTAGPNGPVHGLFQMQNGNVTALNTGLENNFFPSLSRDGRFVTIAANDPARPFQAATSLFLFDRATGNRTLVVSHSSQQQPDGSFVTPHAQFSALSPNNQLIALHTLLMVTTNLPSSDSTPMLTVNQASDGFQLSLAEIGQGRALDFFRSEYVGISWAPNGSVFATPAYVPTPTQMGGLGNAVGIVLFGLNSGTGQWQRVGQATQPRIFDSVIPNVIESHILPAFSPDGGRIAFFEMTWPDALLQSPASARLLAVDTNGSAPMVLATFNPGFFPMGVAWSPDGTEVIYSIAPQTHIPGAGFFPSGEPSGAVIRKVNSTNPVAIEMLPGIDAGFFPNSPRVPTTPGNGGSGVDLRQVPVTLSRGTGNNLVFRASGLDPETVYRLESSTDLRSFGSGETFTGQQIMNGVNVAAGDNARVFYRLRTQP